MGEPASHDEIDSAVDPAGCALHSRSLYVMQTTSLVVGEVADGCAVLSTDDLHVVRLPLALLPAGVAVGNVVDVTIALNPSAAAQRDEALLQIQRELCGRLRLAPNAAAGDWMRPPAPRARTPVSELVAGSASRPYADSPPLTEATARSTPPLSDAGDTDAGVSSIEEPSQVRQAV